MDSKTAGAAIEATVAIVATEAIHLPRALEL